MSGASGTWQEVMRYCRGRIQQLADEYQHWQPAPGEGRKPPLGKLLQFAGDTVFAIEVEMEHERPLQAMVLVRVLFELTNRLALASMQVEGFKRLLAYWLEQDKRLAEEVLESSLFDHERRQEQQVALEQIRSSLDSLAKQKVKAAPGRMNCVLREITKSSDGGAARDFPWDKRTYSLYRDLCSASHGNVLSFRYPWSLRELGKPLVMHVAYATVGLMWTVRQFMKQKLSEADLQEMQRLPDEASALAFH